MVIRKVWLQTCIGGIKVAQQENQFIFIRCANQHEIGKCPAFKRNSKPCFLFACTHSIHEQVQTELDPMEALGVISKVLG